MNSTPTLPNNINLGVQDFLDWKRNINNTNAINLTLDEKLKWNPKTISLEQTGEDSDYYEGKKTKRTLSDISEDSINIENTKAISITSSDTSHESDTMHYINNFTGLITGKSITTVDDFLDLVKHSTKQLHQIQEHNQAKISPEKLNNILSIVDELQNENKFSSDLHESFEKDKKVVLSSISQNELETKNKNIKNNLIENVENNISNKNNTNTKIEPNSEENDTKIKIEPKSEENDTKINIEPKSDEIKSKVETKTSDEEIVAHLEVMKAEDTTTSMENNDSTSPLDNIPTNSTDRELKEKIEKPRKSEFKYATTSENNNFASSLDNNQINYTDREVINKLENPKISDFKFKSATKSEKNNFSSSLDNIHTNSTDRKVINKIEKPKISDFKLNSNHSKKEELGVRAYDKLTELPYFLKDSNTYYERCLQKNIKSWKTILKDSNSYFEECLKCAKAKAKYKPSRETFNKNYLKENLIDKFKDEKNKMIYNKSQDIGDQLFINEFNEIGNKVKKNVSFSHLNNKEFGDNIDSNKFLIKHYSKDSPRSILKKPKSIEKIAHQKITNAISSTYFRTETKGQDVFEHKMNETISKFNLICEIMDLVKMHSGKYVKNPNFSSKGSFSNINDLSENDNMDSNLTENDDEDIRTEYKDNVVHYSTLFQKRVDFLKKNTYKENTDQEKRGISPSKELSHLEAQIAKEAHRRNKNRIKSPISKKYLIKLDELSQVQKGSFVKDNKTKSTFNKNSIFPKKTRIKSPIKQTNNLTIKKNNNEINKNSTLISSNSSNNGKIIKNNILEVKIPIYPKRVQSKRTKKEIKSEKKESNSPTVPCKSVPSKSLLIEKGTQRPQSKLNVIFSKPQIMHQNMVLTTFNSPFSYADKNKEEKIIRQVDYIKTKSSPNLKTNSRLIKSNKKCFLSTHLLNKKRKSIPKIVNLNFKVKKFQTNSKANRKNIITKVKNIKSNLTIKTKSSKKLIGNKIMKIKSIKSKSSTGSKKLILSERFVGSHMSIGSKKNNKSSIETSELLKPQIEEVKRPSSVKDQNLQKVDKKLNIRKNKKKYPTPSKCQNNQDSLTGINVERSNHYMTKACLYLNKMKKHYVQNLPQPKDILIKKKISSSKG